MQANQARGQNSVRITKLTLRVKWRGENVPVPPPDIDRSLHRSQSTIGQSSVNLVSIIAINVNNHIHRQSLVNYSYLKYFAYPPVSL